MKWIKTFESASKKYSLENALDQSIISPRVKKLRFTFPKDNFEEFACNILQKLGIVTCFFRNISEVIQEIKRIKGTGFIADEVVIETHGISSYPLITKEEGFIGNLSHDFLDRFLPQLKSIISKDSKVIFTSCEGANDLFGLKRAAEKLGCRVYASQGYYFPARNYSEKGWYYCNPNTKMEKSYSVPTNDELIKKNHCMKCETPISWVKWLVPSGH
jgi:hypothetical protein